MDERKPLSELKPGDKVIQITGYGPKTESILVVTRLTKTRVMVRTPNDVSASVEYAYKIDTGEAVSRERYHTNQIYAPTDADMLRVREGIQRRRLVRAMQAVKWDTLPLNVLQDIHKVILAQALPENGKD